MKGMAAASIVIATFLSNTALPNSANDFKYDLPKILTAKDANLYTKVFDLQRNGNWALATEVEKKIDDKLLKSHTLFQRFMHPTKYRAKFSELQGWLERFADRPGARRIYILAQKRLPMKGMRLREPRLPRIQGVLSEEIILSNGAPFNPKLSKRSPKKVRKILLQINKLVSQRKTRIAERLTNTRENIRILRKSGLSRAEAALARGYYHEKNDRRVLALADRAAKRETIHRGDTNWWGGLAGWRLKEFKKSATYFAKLSKNTTIKASLRTAAGFWAARAYLRASQPSRVNQYLKAASQNPRTFYGMLASYLLGNIPKFNWAIPTLKPHDIAEIKRQPRLKRALALIQINERVRAETEMKFVSLSQSRQSIRILLNIAIQGGLPQLAYRLGHSVLNEDGKPFDRALYPVTIWRPKGGFLIDQALIFAIMRQESNFRSRASSRMGAAGLMQLMPRTARALAKNNLWDGRRSALYNPVLNITLGQQYLHRLLKNALIDRNLFYTIAAYNSGPGNLYRWHKEIEFKSDPLLFIESIPARETRTFVEQVLANYWIYRQRLNQKAPSLEKLARGEWPAYIALDP